MNYGKIKISVIVVAIIMTIIALVLIKQRYPNPDVIMPAFNYPPQTVSPSLPATTTPRGQTPAPSPTPPPDPVEIKTTLLLAVPFTPQAPTGNWDTIHNEDCEEASAVMANAYFNGPHTPKLDTQYVEGQLTKLTDWEMKTFGYNLDITSEETVEMIKANYGLNAKMVTDFSEASIKKELAQDHLVLIPVNGQMIGNPNYKQPGPKYHVLVIRGYTATSIITNDPGTRNGLNYAYSYSTLYKASGNWSHVLGKVDLNDKNIIVVWK